MKRALTRLWRRALRALGPSGAAAVAVLAVTVAVAAWIPKLNQQGDQLRRAVATKAALASTSRPPMPRPAPPGEQVQEFVAELPPFAQNADDLDEVFRSASSRKVQLLKGEYQLNHDPRTPLLAYTATYPVRSEYAALKDFVADVLRTLPNASLDDLRLARGDAGSVMLDAVIRFTFVYRSVPDGQ